MASTTPLTFSTLNAGPVRPRRFATESAESGSQVALLLSLGVIFVLLTSTVDAVWIERGSFTGSGSFDALAGFKLFARGLAVVFAGWLLLQVGAGAWLFADRGLNVLALFFVYGAASAAYSAVPILSVTRAVSFLGVLFFAVVLLRYVSDTGQFERFWKGFYVTLGLYVTLVFVASLLLDAAGLGDRRAGWEGRLTSLYGPNGAASLAGLVFIWSFVRLTGRIGVKTALFFLFASGAFLVLALSRGAMVTVFSTCAAYAVWRKKGTQWLTVLCFVAGVTLVVASATGLGSSGLLDFFTRGDSTDRIRALNGRIPLYGYLLFEQFPQYPVFGVGFQMLSEAGLEVDVPAHVAVSRGSWMPGHAHNALLQILIGTGLVGLSIYLLAWGLIVRGLVTRVKAAAPKAYEAMVPLMWFLLLNAMIETTLTGTIDPNYLVAVLMGATTCATYPRSPLALRRPPKTLQALRT